MSFTTLVPLTIMGDSVQMSTERNTRLSNYDKMGRISKIRMFSDNRQMIQPDWIKHAAWNCLVQFATSMYCSLTQTQGCLVGVG